MFLLFILFYLFINIAVYTLPVQCGCQKSENNDLGGELIEKGVAVGAHHQPEYTAQHGGEQSAQFIVPDAEHYDVASP